MELASQLDIIQLKLPIRQNRNEIIANKTENFGVACMLRCVQMEVIFCFNGFLVCILQKFKKKESGGGVR